MTVLYSVLMLIIGGLVPLFVYAQQPTCTQDQEILESALIANPNDLRLQSLWMALQLCSDNTIKPTPSPAASHLPAQIRLEASMGEETNPKLNSSAPWLLFNTDLGVKQLPLNNLIKSSLFSQLNIGYKQSIGANELALQGQVKRYQDELYPVQTAWGADWLRRHDLAQSMLLGAGLVDSGWLKMNYARIGHLYQMDAQQYLLPELRAKWFETEPALNGNEAIVTWGYQQDAGWSAAASLGYNTATGARAGGDYALYDAQLKWRGQWAGSHLELQGYVRRQLDQAPYSELLYQSGKRDLTLTGVALSVHQSIDKDSRLYARLESMQQVSNIALFAWENRQIQVGWVYLW